MENTPFTVQMEFLGVIAILVPGFRLLKEWAYAGIFFVITGAIISHTVTGDEARTLFGPALLPILIIISWYFRPANKSKNKSGETQPRQCPAYKVHCAPGSDLSGRNNK